MVYLDYAAHSPIYFQAADKLRELSLLPLGSPGGIHSAAAQARGIMQQSRRGLAGLLGILPQELFFTSGGTESNNWAIKQALSRSGRRHVIVSASSHKSVLEAAKAMERQGAELSLVRPDRSGLISPADLEALIRPDTGLISVESVNNETGVVQNIEAIAALAKSRSIIFHCDAVQSFAHSPLPLEKAGLVSLSAHKLGGPAGIGALVIRQPLMLAPLLHGGGQELGLRSGTENVAGMAAFALAAELSFRDMEQERERLSDLTARFQSLLLAVAPEMEINGAEAPRQPGILNCHFPGISGEELVMRLDMRGICASPGAACAAREGGPSHVLMAMGLGRERASQSLRFSLGRDTGPEDLEFTARAVGEILGKRG